MKISYRWLHEFVETDLPPAAVADRLVNAGIEVASVQPLVEGLSGVVIGEIEAIEKDLGVTPAGHHNRLCRVALPDKTFSVICGALRWESRGAVFTAAADFCCAATLIFGTASRTSR